jgi:hypothetical protein
VSDETNDVVVEVPADAVAAEPVAPAELEVGAAIQAAVDVGTTTFPDEAEVPIEAPEPPPVTPVLTVVPSSQSETQQPESAPEVEEAPLSLVDAVSVLLVYVKAHRTAGDADLEAAVADVEASLAAQA